MKRRTRPQFQEEPFEDSLLIKKPKYECIKWNCDISLCPIDEEVLEASLQIYVQNHQNICPNIGKIIAEFALGWIKTCPFCEIQEILILPSDLMIPIWAQQCQNCEHRLYIHTCDFHHPNGYESCNWWLHWKPAQHTRIGGYSHSPYQNMCKLCEGLQTKESSFLYKICSQCSYKCCLCQNTFCNDKHMGYHCTQCNLNYCQMCHEYCLSRVKKSCINCFYNLEKYVSYYPNLQDRLMFNNYFGSLFDDDDDDDNDGYGLNLIIPSNVIYFIVAFINGNIINCCKQNCKQDIVITPYLMNYLHHDAHYTDRIVKCRSGHINCIHICDLCYMPCIINDISNLYYAFIQRYRTIYTDDPCYSAVDIPNIRICSVCWDESGKITKICSNCYGECSECDSLLCPYHSLLSMCQSCGDTYCVSHWEEWNQDHCQLCDHTVCWHCQIIRDVDLETYPGYFNCLDRYNVCNGCFSPYIQKFYNFYGGYASCLEIVETIRETSIFGKGNDHIIDIISVYATEHHMI